MAEDTSGGRSSSVRDRTPASSIVAELWAEREQSGPSPGRPSPDRQPPDRRSRDPRPGPAPRPSRTRTRTRTGPPVGWLAVAIVAVGAGGAFVVAQGDPRPSKTQFVAKADAVCGLTNSAVTSVPRASSYPELATAAGTVVTATEAQLGLLHKVGLPGLLDRGRASSVVKAMEATQKAGRGLQSAAVASDDAGTALAAQNLLVASQEATAKAADYGLSVCASGMKPGVDILFAGSGAVVKDAYLAKANVLCAAAVKAAEAVTPMGKDPADLRRFIGQTMGTLSKMNTELRALPVPPGDEATLTELYATIDKTNAKGLALVDAAIAVDRTIFPVAEREFTKLGEDVGIKMAAYGFGPCGYNEE